MTHALFTLIGHTVSSCTNAGYPTMHLSIKSLAHILSTLEKNKEKPTNKLAEELEKKLLDDIDLKNSIETCRPKQRHVNRLGITKADKKKGRDYHRIHDFAEIIAQAHEQHPYYHVNSAYSILMAAVYAKAQTKEDIWNFFSIIEQDLGVPILQMAQHDLFITTTYPRTKKERIALLQTEVNGPMQENLEQILVMSLLNQKPGKTPPFALHKSLYYREQYYMGDCMETAIRNISNDIVFDPEKKQFKQTASMDSATADFYKEYANSCTICNLKTHLAWLHLVSHRPLIIYSRKLFYDSTGLQQQIKADQKTLHGFVYGLSDEVISIAEKQGLCTRSGNRLTLNGRTFELIDLAKGEIGFEVTPCIRNFITLLDNLHGLNLIHQENFFAANFIGTFLRPLCEKLNLPVLAESLTNSSNGLYDKIDLSSNHATLNFKRYSLTTHEGHGASKPSTPSSDSSLVT